MVLLCVFMCVYVCLCVCLRLFAAVYFILLAFTTHISFPLLSLKLTVQTKPDILSPFKDAPNVFVALKRMQVILVPGHKLQKILLL